MGLRIRMSYNWREISVSIILTAKSQSELNSFLFSPLFMRVKGELSFFLNPSLARQTRGGGLSFHLLLREKDLSPTIFLSTCFRQLCSLKFKKSSSVQLSNRFPGFLIADTKLFVGFMFLYKVALPKFLSATPPKD